MKRIPLVLSAFFWVGAISLDPADLAAQSRSRSGEPGAGERGGDGEGTTDRREPRSTSRPASRTQAGLEDRVADRDGLDVDRRRADDEAARDAAFGDEAPTRRLNLGTRTLGGVQFWGDELYFHEWRIQRNALTGHCRLLDPDNRRQAWGTFEQCRGRLEEIKRQRELPPMRGRAVLVLHGLGGWRGTMEPLADYLERNSDFTVLNITYPSTRGDLADHARALASVMDNLEGIEEINFVAHSLGNLVIRHYLADAADPESGRSPDPRIKRIVMLAPPNHGSERAARWSDNDLFLAVLGGAAQQLGSGWSSVETRLATPACQFGILAGGRGDERGYSSRLDGDDDGTLSVSTTRLAGARDFMTVPVWHSFMMFHPRVQEYTLRFIEEGYFVSDARRQPILDNGN
jgi:pimeloyl-ACP methyl ester carboxylesterase